MEIIACALFFFLFLAAAATGNRGGRARREEGGLAGGVGWGGIIELSAQWSDGGHVVPLMEEEMSFLAKLIVQKRAEPLFREAPATLPAHLHACTRFGRGSACRHTHTCTPSEEILECERKIHTHTHTQALCLTQSHTANPLISAGVHSACGTFRQQPRPRELRLDY